MINLEITKRTDPRLLERMANHYSHPRGFVGRNICYAIYYDETYFGHIVGGSATRFLPGRNEFFSQGWYIVNEKQNLNHIVNNIFYNVSKVDGGYPTRNFTSKVLKEFCSKISTDWYHRYGDSVWGFETLIEKPRTGELYRKAGWIEVGTTIGYTCKRVGGKGTDKWTGKRVWDTENLKPKVVLCKKI